MSAAPKSGKLKKPHTITLEPEVWSALEKLAEVEERSVSYILNRLAKEHLRTKGMWPGEER